MKSLIVIQILFFMFLSNAQGEETFTYKLVKSKGTLKLKKKDGYFILDKKTAIRYINDQIGMDGTAVESIPENTSTKLNKIFNLAFTQTSKFLNIKAAQPMLVFTNDQGSSAGAVGITPVEQKRGQSNIIFASEGVGLGSDDSILGLFIHELVHYFYKDVEGNTGSDYLFFHQKSDKNYLKNVCSTDSKKCDPEKMKKIVNYISTKEDYGCQNLSELHFIPHDHFQTSYDFLVWMVMIGNVNEKIKACSGIFEEYQQLYSNIMAGHSTLTNRYQFSKEQKKGLEKKSKALLARMRTCLEKNGDKDLLIKSAAYAANMPAVEFLKILAVVRAGIVDAGSLGSYKTFKRYLPILSRKNLLDTFLKIRKKSLSCIQKSKEGVEFKGLRLRTDEDRADLVAIKILVKMKRNAVSFVEDMVKEGYSAKDYLICKQMIKANTEPDYGDLADTHHNACWRLWRAYKVSGTSPR